MQPEENVGLDDVIKNLKNIRDSGDSVKIKTNQFLIFELLRPFLNDYFVYWGALAIGSESKNRVLWIISRVPIPIAQEQV